MGDEIPEIRDGFFTVGVAMKTTGVALSFLIGMFVIILTELFVFPLWMELDWLQPIAQRLGEGGHSGAVTFSLLVSANIPNLVAAFLLGFAVAWFVRKGVFLVLLGAAVGILLGPLVFQWIAFESSPAGLIGALTVPHVLTWWGVSLVFLLLGAGCVRRLKRKKGGSSG